MKNLFKIFLATLVGMFLVISCDRDGDLPTLQQTAKPTLDASTIPTTIAVNLNNAATPVEVKFTKAAFSPVTPVDSELQMAVAGTNFAKPVKLGNSTSETSIKLLYSEINKALLEMGAEAGKAVKIDVRLKSSIKTRVGNLVNSSFSDPVTITVTPMALTSYMYLPGDYQGWDPKSANELISENSNGIYHGLASFVEGKKLTFKVTQNRAWDGNDYGSTDGKTLVKGGSDILAPAHDTYKITANLNNMTLAMEKHSIGIIGDATAGGWDADQNMVWNDAAKQWEATLDLKAGKIKFRLNDGWDVNYGGSGTPGVAKLNGDDMSISAAGTYKIIFNDAKLTYSVTKQ